MDSKARYYSVVQVGERYMPAKMIRDVTIGSATAKLGQTPKGFVGVVFEGSVRKAYEEGDDGDVIWQRMLEVARRLNPLFFGYDGARARFLKFFPSGFGDAGYLNQERAYKLEAKAKLDESAPLPEALIGSGHGEDILRAFRDTNLLFRLEKTRLQSLLRGPSADEFVQAAAAFANGDLKQPLAAMKSLLKPHDNAKWTVVTYLPFLWRPDVHFFLKPTAMRDFAERVGHRFHELYSPDLDLSTYEALLDMAEETRRETVDLQPLDLIDIQSFMWTAVEYKEGDRPDE
jgi:hypothetical protein